MAWGEDGVGVRDEKKWGNKWERDFPRGKEATGAKGQGIKFNKPEMYHLRNQTVAFVTITLVWLFKLSIYVC